MAGTSTLPLLAVTLRVQLAKCWNTRVSRGTDCGSVERMFGDNLSGAGNQQERPGIEQWVVGFVVGEGCFSCAIQRNRAMGLGWQVQPRFVVVQGEKSRSALEVLGTVLGCGRIYRNRRHDNHKEDLLKYQVLRMDDLCHRIVPFFEANPLITTKHEDFLKFREILGMMERRLHLSIDGLRRIALVTETMNQRKPSRFLESSEAIRQPTLIDVRVEEMVLPPRRRGEAEERNSLSGEQLPCTGAIPCEDPLITAEPTPAAFKERR